MIQQRPPNYFIVSKRQEPYKPDSKKQTTTQAYEHLFRLGKARQQLMITPPHKTYDSIQKENHNPCFFYSGKDYSLDNNMSRETSTTAESFDFSVELRSMNENHCNLGKHISKSQSRTKSSTKREGKAKDKVGGCDPPVYNRLYERSKKKQVEGKRRRQQIEQAIAAKHAIPDWSDWTIPLDRAEDYYHKSISRALSRERKMVLAAYKMGLKYEPKYSFNSSTLGYYGWR